MNKTKGFLFLLATGIFYAINDNLIRIIARELSNYQQVFYRVLIALIAIGIFNSLRKTSWNLYKTPKIYIFLYAISFPLTLILFTFSLTLTKIGASVFSFYGSYLVISLLISIFFFKEKVTANKLLSLISVFIGLTFFTFPFDSQIFNKGFGFGLLAGLTLVLTNTFSKHFGRKIDASLLATFQMIGGICISGLIISLTNGTFLPHVSFITAIATIISGILLFFVIYLPIIGFKTFDIHVGAILTSSELFFAPFFAYFLFNEALTFRQIFGGIFIALAIIISHVKINLDKQLTSKFPKSKK